MDPITEVVDANRIPSDQRIVDAAGHVSQRVPSDDPHLNAVGFWQPIEHPTEGLLRVARFPGSWSRTQPDIRRLAPNRGEPTDEVLAEARAAAAAAVSAGGDAAASPEAADAP